ncbi:unnamed protein product [Nezara viridula]|uniref:Uncharacterized protein n=1 Tax=Nezara viridula TaxID=85310 RepID=A0A9P0MVP9_NEZVI|nr:unnamed protein product [Nezara viridula]
MDPTIDNADPKACSQIAALFEILDRRDEIIAVPSVNTCLTNDAFKRRFQLLEPHGERDAHADQKDVREGPDEGQKEIHGGQEESQPHGEADMSEDIVVTLQKKSFHETIFITYSCPFQIVHLA